MTDHLRDKLKTLPAEPGVYFHRDAKGKIIYIGKAAVLKNRVMSYFQNKHRDPKTRLLVADIADTEWVTVGSEVEALFLESEFIKRYKPKYNIDLKDDKNFLYVKISADDFPVVSYVRRPLDDRAHYYGPFTSSDSLRRAMRMLRKVFPYITHANWPKRGCLQYHLGLCPGPEEGAIDAIDYRRGIRKLELYLKGEQTKLMTQLETEMQRAAKKKDFEHAARLRDQLTDLRSFGKQMVFGDKEAFDLTRDQALTGLAERLELKSIPRRIEAYDISHLGGVDNVASMVVFNDGVPNRDEYKRFKMNLTGNDDYGHMREVITRRFSPKNAAEWPKPDLLLIDGGQGQLAAALSVLDAQGLSVPAIGLAKREEEIIRRHLKQEGVAGHWDNEAWVTANTDFESILLPASSHVLQLLQRVRDEAHRFAITYQSILRGKRATHSLLDEIPGVGPATRKLLIRRFGSVRGVKLATLEEVSAAIGPAKAQAIKEHLGQTPAPTLEATSDDMSTEER
ncbi:MAG: putative excinuclease subunit domain protein [Patescibacteria group bacterium]|nr:putative excinuclease subunit domain protein [Patescibacteria group bacterium]